MKRKLFKLKGDSNYLSALIVLSILMTFCVFYMYAFIQTVQLNDIYRVHRKYLLSMERTGYLTDEMRINLLNDLDSHGLTNISLSGTSFTPVGYGNPVFLGIEGDIRLGGLDITEHGGVFFNEEVRHVSIKNKKGTALY